MFEIMRETTADSAPAVANDGPKSHDVEKAPKGSNETFADQEAESSEENKSAFKSLGWLDRLLAVWILLAMVIGVLLGNFVPETGPALDKGKFVGVSVPIGKSLLVPSGIYNKL